MKIDTLLVPIDFSDCSQHALTAAGRLACEFGASVEVLHVLEQFVSTHSAMYGFNVDDAGIRARAWKDSEERLDHLIRETAELDGLEVGRHVRVGRSDHEIVDQASAGSWVIMGTHGRTGLSHFLIGSIAERVLRRAEVPVMTIKEPAFLDARRIRSVLFPTDVHGISAPALEIATELAETFDATLDILFVAEDPVQYGALAYEHLPGSSPEELRAFAQDRAREKLIETVAPFMPSTERVSSRVCLGVPYEEICRHARASSTDLLVMATHGRTGLAHALLGSVAERVVRAAPCPVLTLGAE